MSLERATAALSSADMAQPIFGKLQSFKRDNVNAAMVFSFFAVVVVECSRCFGGGCGRKKRRKKKTKSNSRRISSSFVCYLDPPSFLRVDLLQQRRRREGRR